MTENRSPRSQALALVACVLLTALACYVIRTDLWSYLRGPAEGGWRWPYLGKPTATRLLPALACFAGLVAVASVQGKIMRQTNRILAFIAGMGLVLALANLEIPGTVTTLVDRTLDPSFTSHHTVAASPMASRPGDYVDRHAALLPDLIGSAMHSSTHPPGPVLVHRALIGLCAMAPGMSAQGKRWINEKGLGRRWRSTQAEVVLSAFLAALLMVSAMAATAWPLERLATRLSGSPTVGTRTAILWFLLPAPVLMVPEWDQAIALPVTASWACLAAALSTKKYWGAAVAAGLSAGIATGLSYGAPLLVGIGGVALVGWSRTHGASLRRIVAVCGTATGITGVIWWLPAIWGHEPLQAMRTALRIHRAIVNYNTEYILPNLIDFSLFLGLPIAGIFLFRCVRSHRVQNRDPGFPVQERAINTARTILLVLVVTFLTSGLVRGEAGRIALPLMPIILATSLADTKWNRREFATIASCLFALCVTIRLYWQVP